MTNCVFQNNQQYTGWFDGQSYATFGSTASTDTVWMVDNTFFCNDSYILATNYFNEYTKFDHNTVFLTAANPFFLPQLTHADIENNIFYGTLGEGQLPAEIKGGWFDWDGQPSSTISFDTLTNVGANYNLTESDRYITVKNNAYFWPKTMTDWWTHWNDSVTTAGAQDSELVTPPTWMNSRTATMFGDKTMWPHLDSAGNQNVDPQFPSSATSQVDSLMQYVYLTRTGGLKTYLWWYVPQANIANGQYGPFPPVWPLPYSLAYTNTALQSAGTDGKALGDLNWFPDQLPLAVRQTTPTAPTKFALSDNYPNPFNPSTTVKVTLAQSGVASLRIYNVLGQLVKVVEEGYKPAGTYTYDINMNMYASGVYFYSLQQGSNLITKKMLLLK